MGDPRPHNPAPAPSSNQTWTAAEAQRLLDAVIHSVSDYAIILLDTDGKVLTWNSGAAAIKGYQPGEILGHSFTRFYAPEDVVTGKPMSLLAQAKRDGRVEAEGWRVRKDGSRFWGNIVISAVKDDRGEVVGYLKVTRDLTNRKAAEEETRLSEERLRTSEEKLRLMIASVQDYAIFMLDSDGRVVSWNPGAERMKGYRADEIEGAHFSLFYAGEDRATDKAGRELATAAAHGRFEDEGWRVRKDGTRFWANVVISAVRDERGQLIGFTKVTRDMTDRKRAEEQMLRRAGQQSALADLGLHAIGTRDLASVLQAAMETAVKTLGTEMSWVLEWQSDRGAFLVRAAFGIEEGSVGQEVAADPSFQPGFTFQSSEPVVVGDFANETRFASPPLQRDNRVVSGISVVIPAVGASGYGVIGTFARKPRFFSPDDIHFFRAVANIIGSAIARSQAEEQRRRAQISALEEREKTARAERAVRERDVFLSIAAHELRTPLTALQLKLQGLERLVLSNASTSPRFTTMAERFQDALRQTGRLAELVERLLDVSRIAGGRFEMHPEPLDLAALVRDVVNDFREKATNSGIEFIVSATGDMHGEWDRRRLEQVLANLLSNALKYGDRKPVEVSMEGRDAEVRIVVADRGIGIASSDAARIFQPFERAAPIENFPGLGLGLYISRRIVEAHGGRIDVTSRPREGATFVVTLPKAFATRTEDASAAPGQP